MQNATVKRFATLMVGAILAIVFAAGTAVAPIKAYAAEPIDVALTVVDTTTQTVYYNKKVTHFTADNTVGDLLAYAGFTKGSKEESAADEHVYFTNAYGVVCFLGKGHNVSGDYMWLNCLNGDSGYWDEAAVNEKLQPNTHYQYAFDRSTKYLFNYSEYCPDPMAVTESQDEVIPGGQEPEAFENPQPGLIVENKDVPEIISPEAPAADTSIQITGLSFDDATYAGKYLKPGVCVANANGDALVEGKDFTVTFNKNKLVGKASVTVQGMGEYEGTDTASFIIHPKATSIKKVTSTKTSIKVAYKKLTTQNSGYQVAVSTDENFETGKAATATSTKTLNRTIKNLKRHTKYYVKVRTYKKVNGEKIYSAWSKVKTVKTK